MVLTRAQKRRSETSEEPPPKEKADAGKRMIPRPSKPRRRPQPKPQDQRPFPRRMLIWGDNGRNSSDSTDCHVPVEPFPERKPRILNAALGCMHMAVQIDDRWIYTSGYNHYGQLGRSTNNNGCHLYKQHFSSPGVFSPLFCSSDEKIDQIVCTFYATFVRTNKGCIYGWGTFRDIHGNTAFADRVDSCWESELVYDAQQDNPVVKIAAGANHIVAVLKSGAVLSWGAGDLGQLGRPPENSGRSNTSNTQTRGLSPAAMVFQKKMAIVDAFCTDFCTFLKDKFGRIFACGLNDCGQLAIHPEQLSIEELADEEKRVEANIVVTQLREIEVLTDLRMKKIVGGKDHCLGLTEEGAVYSWGSSEHGVLGRQDSMSTIAGGVVLPDPRLVDGFEGSAMIDVAAGYTASGAIDGEGKVYTWGKNSFYRLGHPIGEDHQEPIPTELELKLEPNCKPTHLFIGTTSAALLFDDGL